MISRRVGYPAAAWLSCLFMVGFAASCGSAQGGDDSSIEASDEYSATSALSDVAIGSADDVGEADSTDALRGQCPSGWFDASMVHIDCRRGFAEAMRDFGRTRCIRCVQADSPNDCSDPWVIGSHALSCAPGEVTVRRGACKRCSDGDAGACRTDEDCVRTGCSGQVCSDREVITTCEWRDEYACYARPFARCGCDHGQCGWEETLKLTECIGGAGR